jgi:hypothetical protein
VVEQEGVARDEDTKIFQKARPRLPSESEGDVREPAIEPLGCASVVRGDTGQSLREDSSVAGFLVAEGPPHVQVNRVTGIPCQGSRSASILSCNENGPWWIPSRTPDKESNSGGGPREESNGVFSGTNPG